MTIIQKLQEAVYLSHRNAKSFIDMWPVKGDPAGLQSLHTWNNQLLEALRDSGFPIPGDLRVLPDPPAEAPWDPVTAQARFLAMEDGWQPGAFVVSTWGYSMVITDFYVIASRSPTSVVLAPWTGKIVSGDGMRGTVIPGDIAKGADDHDVAWRTEADRAKPIRRKLKGAGKDIACKVSSGCAVLWNGKPQGFDHLD